MWRWQLQLTAGLHSLPQRILSETTQIVNELLGEFAPEDESGRNIRLQRFRNQTQQSVCRRSVKRLVQQSRDFIRKRRNRLVSAVRRLDNKMSGRSKNRSNTHHERQSRSRTRQRLVYPKWPKRLSCHPEQFSKLRSRFRDAGINVSRVLRRPTRPWKSVIRFNRLLVSCRVSGRCRVWRWGRIWDSVLSGSGR